MLFAVDEIIRRIAFGADGRELKAITGDAVRTRRVDDGPGLPAGGGVPGVGLSNTRARLAELYGAAARLELDDTPGGGLTVTVSLPRRA